WFLLYTNIMTGTNGVALATMAYSMCDSNIAATATDLIAYNTSSFSPVDTDGDGIPDAWELYGIDWNEDGTVDLKLTNACPYHKDVYVEIDTMSNRVPNMANLGRINV